MFYNTFVQQNNDAVKHDSWAKEQLVHKKERIRTYLLEEVS